VGGSGQRPWHKGLSDVRLPVQRADANEALALTTGALVPVTLFITIHKAQGENRERLPGGKLEATQHAQYFARLRFGSIDARQATFTSRRKGSASLVKKDMAEVFGDLEWKGTPETEGMYGMAKVNLTAEGPTPARRESQHPIK
jgi:hypothetical protein